MGREPTDMVAKIANSDVHTAQVDPNFGLPCWLFGNFEIIRKFNNDVRTISYDEPQFGAFDLRPRQHRRRYSTVPNTAAIQNDHWSSVKNLPRLKYQNYKESGRSLYISPIRSE